jgi:hypothetical protein
MLIYLYDDNSLSSLHRRLLTERLKAKSLRCRINSNLRTDERANGVSRRCSRVHHCHFSGHNLLRVCVSISPPNVLADGFPLSLSIERFIKWPRFIRLKQVDDGLNKTDSQRVTKQDLLAVLLHTVISTIFHGKVGSNCGYKPEC